MIDPDLRSIQRRRRQQKRCLHCGVATPRATLCRSCRATRRYCPRCEVVWVLDAPRRTTDGRTADYCRPCANLVRNGRRPSRGDYLAQQRAGQHPKLRQIIKLYRAGATYPAIAAALGIPRGTLTSIIHHAKQTSRWPAALRRTAAR